MPRCPMDLYDEPELSSDRAKTGLIAVGLVASVLGTIVVAILVASAGARPGSSRPPSKSGGSITITLPNAPGDPLPKQSGGRLTEEQRIAWRKLRRERGERPYNFAGFVLAERSWKMGTQRSS